jgi:4-amino-4-deoxy-L-arabinose transferase-like glycosyltransferase
VSAVPPAPSDRAVVRLAVLFALVAGVVTLCLRTVEVEAEYDRYHQMAEQLLQGHVVFDRFHPFGYPMLVAGVLWVVGDSLVAGCLVSSIAAGVVIWASGHLAEGLRAGAGLGAAVLVAGNGVVWVYATMASSDMAAAAAAMAAVALVVRAPTPLPVRRAFVVGLLLGLGISMRFAAAFVLLFVGLWLLRRGGLRAALAAAFGAVVGDAPQAIPSLLLTGSPLANENWHNVYLKVVCHFDYECLQRAYDTGTMPSAFEFVRGHFADIVGLGLADSWIACSEFVSSMLLGATRPEAASWLWPLLLAALGLVWLSTARRTGAVVLLFALLHVLSLCLVFEPRTRVLLTSLPPLCVGLAVLCRSLPRPSWQRLGLGAAVAGSLWFGVASYGRFLADQPVAEVALLRDLPGLVQRPMVLLTTFPVADRYVGARVLGYMAPGNETPAATWHAVRVRMEAGGADVFVTGRASSPQVFSHLTGTPPPPDFVLLRRDAAAVAFERPVVASPWIEAFTVAPPSPRVGEQVVFTLRLAATVAPVDVAGAGIVVADAAGVQSLFDLPPAARGVFEHAFDVPPVPGDWRLTPFVVRSNGQVLRGAEVHMHVQP